MSTLQERVSTADNIETLHARYLNLRYWVGENAHTTQIARDKWITAKRVPERTPTTPRTFTTDSAITVKSGSSRV